MFDGRPAIRDEFLTKLEKSDVPEKFEANEYVSKKLCSHIRLVTDIGIELIIPSELYCDGTHMKMDAAEDGTRLIKLSNIGEIYSK